MLSKSKFGQPRVENLQGMIDKILSMWDTHSTQEIADELNIPKTKISYYMGQLRKKGVNIPKKVGLANDTIWNDIANKYKEKYGTIEKK